MWGGHISAAGYGKVSINGKVTYAHRVSYSLTFGAIPDGLHVCHRCDNPSCVRPDHLFLGTHQDNMNDRDQKGRTGTGAKVGRPQKFTPEQIRMIRTEHAETGLASRPLARKYGVNRKTMQRILKGELWKYVE